MAAMVNSLWTSRALAFLKFLSMSVFVASLEGKYRSYCIFDVDEDDFAG